MGNMHLVRTQAACIYLFHSHKLILCGFNQIFHNHKWVFFNHNQPISITNNPKQSFAINQIFTTISTNKYRPWFVDEGRINIYIFVYSNSLLFQHIYNFYNAYITYISNVQLIKRLYKWCTTLI